jgi:hypothetical protein
MKTSSRLMAMMVLLALTAGCGYSRPAAVATPTITTLAPTSTAAGGAAFTLTVNGTKFASNSVVYWNGTPRTTVFGTANQLNGQITAADIATAGMGAVTVFTPGSGYGGNTTSNSVNFTIN